MSDESKDEREEHNEIEYEKMVKEDRSDHAGGFISQQWLIDEVERLLNNE